MALPQIAPYPLPSAAPPSRLDWTLDPARAVLLVHDMQNHFAGAFERAEEPLTSAVRAIARLAATARSAGVPVVYTVQPGGQSPVERGLQLDLWGGGVPAGGTAEAVVDELRPLPGDHVLTKWRYNAFLRTGLDELMDDLGRDQLVITGVYAHIGCLVTATHAFMTERQPFLVADAVADFSADEHRMALDYVAGRAGVVLVADEVDARLRAGRVAEVAR